ncbi:MAG TPA: rRNA adenine N-6-methyltransferase family protein [Streptosporangiaceae bacterium]|nr:rRNA adenine N-6-methyltransferase family protein [Streptosporangiaceae bacterium]
MSATARSRRAWGWHPLTDEWAARIVADAAVRPGELVLDIGAGHGALTAELVERGARVVAVELHPARVRQLRGRFAGLPVTVVHADAVAMRLPRRPFRVVASPPYAISGRLLRLLLAPSSPLTAADLVLQRAVVQRYTGGRAAGPGRFGRRWRMRAGRSLPRRAFRPPPRVDSAVLIVRRR